MAFVPEPEEILQDQAPQRSKMAKLLNLAKRIYSLSREYGVE
ncbi:MAG: hypothetical protein AAF824_03025 [Bacteroidota bacterium]